MNKKSVKTFTIYEKGKDIFFFSGGNLVSFGNKTLTINTTIIGRKYSSMTPPFLKKF